MSSRRDKGEIGGADVGLRRETVSDDPAVLYAPNHGLYLRMVEAEHREAVERDVLDEALEGVAHPVERAVVIEMIGVDVGHDRNRCRQLQESAVALVGLDDDPLAGAEPRIRAVSIDDSAVHDGRVHAAGVEKSRDHRRRRCLAVRAGDGDAGTKAHDLRQHLGTTHQRQAERARGVEFGIARLHRRRIDHGMRTLQVVHAVADEDGNAQLAQTPDAGAFRDVGALNLVAEIVHDFGDAAHADPADADEMDRAHIKWNARYVRAHAALASD